MPELPEVETFRRYFNNHALNKPISSIKVTDTGILTDESQKSEITQKLIDISFIRTQRHGKFMFIHLSKKHDQSDELAKSWLHMHFGMSGYLRFESDKTPLFKHDRVVFYFKGGGYLAYVSQRKFGTLELINSPSKFIKDHHLGPDALNISFNEFRAQLEGRKRSIKSGLLDQGIIAGIGNLYADETLFQTNTYPKIPIRDLNVEKLREIYTTMQKILQTAVDYQANYDRFPNNFFIHSRGKDKRCPRCNTSLERIKITQRTTYYCPNCQPNPQ